jgi:hypothetical protein
MDWSLLITIALIFAASLGGAYVRSTRRDPCLKSFHDFHTTLERTNGKLVWGVMRLEPTGMEFSYSNTVQDENHIEASYLLYAAEYDEIQALYRYADNLSEQGRQKRAADLRRSFHPNPLRRLLRRMRNFLYTATDSLNEVLNLLLGRAQKVGGRYLTDGGSAALGRLGGKVLGQVGGVYDPLLERHIGHRVVIEVLEGDEVHEHVGIFKNYSADFIEVLDVQYPEHQVIEPSNQDDAGRMQISIEGEILRVANQDIRPILIQSIEAVEQTQHIDAVVDCGETIELHPPGPAANVRLHVRRVRELDMILPRSRCVVRHRAEQGQQETLTESVLALIFDVGLTFGLDKNTAPDPDEARLRSQLARAPQDALAAANLGGLLMRRGALHEAERWLKQALSAEYSLPDGGRRVRLQLRELAHRRTGEKSAIASPTDTR